MQELEARSNQIEARNRELKSKNVQLSREIDELKANLKVYATHCNCDKI
jgi:chaperonin cofactor prefoldin